MNITIEQATILDLKEILSLQYLAFQNETRIHNNPNISPLVQTLSELENEFETDPFLKATDENGIIVGSIRGHSEQGTLHIGKLNVHPDCQGQGIGTKLINELECMCPHQRHELFTSSKRKKASVSTKI